ncbi:MAG: bifunctional transaldolase/phosoglucose isomerase [Candidatus Eremiobacteraeota bacterium]|nr:bifunctional transaldolase/phosoglucose isomerase [Candidatus Eremiobacteraeota bacterium]
MEKQLQQLADAGQSVWIDNLRRSMFASGELQRMIDQGLRGMTSNPTIFEKAIGSGNDYDEQLRSLIGREHDAGTLFWELAIKDIQSATDLFRPVYDSLGGNDGFVSLEVSPLLAHDTAGTIAAAKEIWKRVDRPNLMVKIPGTAEGVPAIEECIAEGININVTLIFSIDMYEKTARAYINGLERRRREGKPVDRIRSVNSFFVSRIDTAIDKQIDERIAKGEKLADLHGKTGVANLKLAYQSYLSLFEGPAFAELRAAGASVQRPLWASTSTKNPKYPDLMYVENVVARSTINTMPPGTYDALLDHGKIRPDTILEDLDGARAVMQQLRDANISLYETTSKLVRDGVAAFADSFAALLGAIVYKQKQLSGGVERVAFALGNAQSSYDQTLEQLAKDDFLKRMWAKDTALWTDDQQAANIIKTALGWLDIPQHMLENVPNLQAFAKEVAQQFTHIVVLGMGGSSLAPDILRATFGKIDGYPRLHVLDSTDPLQIAELEKHIDLTETLFIVASKSGTTTEPDAFYRYFHEKVSRACGSSKAGGFFVAITDPGTKLEAEARANNFRAVFTNDPNIGGRYSALSYFGILPAALAGYDINLLLDRGLGAMHADDKTIAAKDAPGVRFGAAIGSLAKAGRDKLTIVTHPQVEAFGAWAEQLIAESTGKLGKGIVPIEGEPLGPPSSYGDDRVFVYVGSGLPEADSATESALATLQDAGHPVIRLAMNDRYDLGEQFYLWEIATAAAGSIIGINAFDQPNVQESKDNTKALLLEKEKKGSFTEPTVNISDDALDITFLSGSKSISANDVNRALTDVFGQIRPHDYVAFTAYVARNDAHTGLLREMRVKVRDAHRVATTVGFGPRFLHSTGQLHKGGPNTGVFLQITADAPFDLQIPGMTGFRTLEAAQALGDFQSLDKRERRGVRVHLKGDIEAGLQALSNRISDALMAALSQ